jgi:hypothetical protein
MGESRKARRKAEADEGAGPPEEDIGLCLGEGPASVCGVLVGEKDDGGGGGRARGAFLLLVCWPGAGGCPFRGRARVDERQLRLDGGLDVCGGARGG